MTSQPGQQTTGIHILPKISRRKSNQAIKLGQLIEYSEGDIFKDYAENEAGEANSRPLFVL